MRYTVDKRHRDDYDPPGASGPRIWYLVGVEPVEIRMTENSIDDCISAAVTLKARHFIMRRPLGLGLPDGWAVFDTKHLDPANNHTPLLLQDGKKARPVRIFDTETLDAPVMWALATGGLN